LRPSTLWSSAELRDTVQQKAQKGQRQQHKGAVAALPLKREKKQIPHVFSNLLIQVFTASK
jgi:hypothetical protein